MNVVEAFKDYLVSRSIGTFAEDLFISRVPSGVSVPDDVWWLRLEGGSSGTYNVNQGNQRPVTISVYRRSVSAAKVYDDLEALNDLVSCSGCLELEGYNVIGVSTIGPFADQDLDGEERTVGMLQVTVTIYKDCNDS